MLHQSTYLQIELGVNDTVSLRGVKDSELRCQSGRVWVTEENGGKDIVLSAGQSHRLTRPGQTVVQSLGLSEGAQCRVVLPRLPYGLMTLLRYWFHDTGADKANLRLVLGSEGGATSSCVGGGAAVAGGCS